MIIKNSSSGRAVFVINEQGTVFSTSWDYIERLKSGKIKSGFIVLSQLPNPVSVDRFPKSPLWDGDKGTTIQENPDVKDDAFAPKNTGDKVKVIKDVML